VLAPSLLGSISTAWAHRTQADTVRLIDPLFARPLSLIRSHKGLDISALPSFMSHFLADADPDQATASPKRPPLNLLLLILESVGTRYIADQSRGNPVPMPFLHSLTQRGWFWANHFSTANSSPPALFSIFTGLYPVPRMQMFVMRRDVYLPALTGFLGPDYDSFMYTPTSLRWYFPQAFFANTGPHELVGANKFRNVKKFGSFPNEIDVIKAFVQRLKRAKEPFFGTYFSFIPHGPYDDYGPKYRIFKDIKRDINRYFNNLHLLDILLRKLFDELESSGLIDRTLVVIVGDHGQAFGQQRGNWGHSRASYNVNYHSPVIFYQPRLIKPRRITRYTSHVDLLPTILDFMGIKYNTELLQGESILQSSFWRRQIFIYGNEHMLSSIDEQQIKLQYSYKYRRCWVYDLRNDPDERERLNCAAYKEQHRALELFYRLQPNLIEQYNKVSREGRDFQGLRHPSFTRKP
jgi:arylsulfatase A-like enzyme